MTSLSQVLQWLLPDGRPLVHWLIEVDDRGIEVISKWTRPEPKPTAQQIAAAELPAAKSIKIAAINAECRSRLITRYGSAEEQVSRAVGVYGVSERDAMETGIGATIDASNTASDQVDAASTVAAVEAVTVAWPVI